MRKLFNKVIKVLIMADVVLLSGIGLVLPIFAIFITDRIVGGNLEVVGYAAAVYWITKSIVIIPFGAYLDRNHGEKDDLIFIMIGSLLAAVTVFGYIFSSLPWHIYLLQAIYAVGMAMNIPGYEAIFTRHIDKGREAFDWSVHSSLLSLGTGIGGALGGIIAYNFGFDVLFTGVGFIIIIAALLPVFCLDDIAVKGGRKKIPPTKVVRPPVPR